MKDNVMKLTQPVLALLGTILLVPLPIPNPYIKCGMIALGVIFINLGLFLRLFLSREVGDTHTDETQRDKKDERDRVWAYLKHADNLHAGRVNFFLVAESMLAVSFVVAWSSNNVNDKLHILNIIAVLGIWYTSGWLYVNVRLDRRKDWLHNKLKELDPTIYGPFLASVGGISASTILSWVLPLLTLIFWVALLCAVRT